MTLRSDDFGGKFPDPGRHVNEDTDERALGAGAHAEVRSWLDALEDRHLMDAQIADVLEIDWVAAGGDLFVDRFVCAVIQPE